MKPETSDKAERRPTYLRVLYILALACVVVFILRIGAPVLMPLTVAAFLAMLLAPMARWLEKNRLGQFMGAILPVIGLLLAFALFASLAVRQISSIGGSLDGAAERVDGFVERTNYFLGWHLNVDEPVLGDLNGEGVVDLVKQSSGDLLTIMGSFTESLFSAFIVPALAFFILYYRNHLFEFCVSFLRRVRRVEVEKRVEEARMVAQQYFLGMLKVVAILAVLNSGALFLIGVEHAIFFGVFSAALNIIPFFGPLFGAILPVLFVFVTRDSLYYPLGVAVAFIVIQLIEGNFLTPRIIGSEVRVNPLIIFTGLLVGAMIWGAIGMIIVIPVLSISMQLFRLNPRTAPFAFLIGIPPKGALPVFKPAD